MSCMWITVACSSLIHSFQLSLWTCVDRCGRRRSEARPPGGSARRWRRICPPPRNQGALHRHLEGLQCVGEIEWMSTLGCVKAIEGILNICSFLFLVVSYLLLFTIFTTTPYFTIFSLGFEMIRQICIKNVLSLDRLPSSFFTFLRASFQSPRRRHMGIALLKVILS